VSALAPLKRSWYLQAALQEEAPPALPCTGRSSPWGHAVGPRVAPLVPDRVGLASTLAAGTPRDPQAAGDAPAVCRNTALRGTGSWLAAGERRGAAAVRQAESPRRRDLHPGGHASMCTRWCPSIRLCGMCRASPCAFGTLVGRVWCEQRGRATLEKGSAPAGRGSRGLSHKAQPTASATEASCPCHSTWSDFLWWWRSGKPCATCSVTTLPAKPARGIPTICTGALGDSFLCPL